MCFLNSFFPTVGMRNWKLPVSINKKCLIHIQKSPTLVKTSELFLPLLVVIAHAFGHHIHQDELARLSMTRFFNCNLSFKIFRISSLLLHLSISWSICILFGRLRAYLPWLGPQSSATTFANARRLRTTLKGVLNLWKQSESKAISTCFNFPIMLNSS